jgi:hypothetical protein
MGISDKMNNFADGVKTGVKSGSSKLILTFFRVVTGFFLGLTFALVGQEVSHYGTLSLVFMTIVVLTIFMRISQNWSIAHILIFDLVMVLVAQLLRMYILLAP